MNNKEIELRIPDLVAMLLKGFRLILCLTLIAALLGGAYGVYSALNTDEENRVTKEDVEAAEKAVTAAEIAISDAEKALTKRYEIEIPDGERKVERAELLVQRRQEYLDNSLYYKMNPFERGVSRLKFYVETNFTVDPDVASIVEDPQTSIVLAYTSIYPFDSEILERVRAIMHTDAEKQYIEELISVSNIADRFVEIRVYHEDAQIAEQVVTYLYQTMLSRLKGSVAEHSANVIGTFTGYEVDWAMNDSHTTNEDSLFSAERSLESAEESLQALKDGIADKEQAITDAKDKLVEVQKDLEKIRKEYENTEPNLSNVAKKAAKYGAIGLIIGLILGCGIVLVFALFGGKIQNQSDVLNRYAFPLIGVLPRTKRVWFDKTIRKLEGEPIGDFEATAQATAQSLLSRIGERKVCLVSSESNSIAEKLAAYTEGRVTVLGNILKNPDAVKELSSFDGIVLVEQRGTSRVDLIDGEVLRAEALGKEILGIVLA